MRIAVCGLIAAMIVQPDGGLDECQLACAGSQSRTAAPRAGAPIAASFKQRAAAIAPIRLPMQKTLAGRLASVATRAPQIEILTFEHPAMSNEDVLGSERHARLDEAAAPTLTDGLNAQAIRIKPSVENDIYPAGKAKSPQQMAQDAWDARQQLAYVAPIAPPEFAYIEIHDLAPDELKTVPGSVGLHGVERGNFQQPDAENISENQNNKSQASSVPTVGQQLELLSK